MSSIVTPRPSLITRLNLILATLAVFIAAFFWLAGPSAEVAIARLLSDGIVVLAWLAAAGGIGASVLSIRNFRRERPLLRACLSIALGIGFIGLITLGAGLCGFLNQATAWAIVAIGFALLIARNVPLIRRLDRATLFDWLKRPASPIWLPMILAGGLVAITCIAALAPPGLLWGDEPNGYDVVEYHLQIPREWFEAHRIVPLSHNVFSYFPQGMEIHSLLAMHLLGGPWAGMYVAQLMHAATVGLAVLSVIALLREQSTTAGVLGGLSMLSMPWLWLLAPVAYVEGLLLLNGTLAIGLALRTFSDHGSRRDVFLAGIFAGLACGVKLTAMPMLVGAIAVAFVADAIVNKRSVRDAGLRLAIFVLTSLAVASPWLIRNFIWTHNPVFPEMTSIFGNGNGRFSADQIERWRRANHEPAAALQSVAGRASEVVHQIVADWRYGFVLRAGRIAVCVPLLIAAIFAACSIRKRGTVALISLIATQSIFWVGFTHLQSRFFVLAIPALAMLIASKDRGRWSVAVAVLILVCCGLSLWEFSSRYAGSEKVLATITTNRLLGVEQLDPLTRVDLSSVDEHQLVTLVGDAGAFWYSRPMSTLRYRTVFDAGAVPSDWLQAWIGERREGEVIVVSPAELERLSRTYWKIPEPPGEVVQRGSPYLMR